MFLKEDRWILFTGTPCQCNALRTYLNKEYDKLIICDIVCHANPSQKVFDKYINDLEEKKNKKILNYEFRTKENGWKNQTPIVVYEDGTREEEGTYFKAFVSELIGRPSCHSCVYADIRRISDFSIADFWGIEKVIEEIENDDTGISLYTVNTEKAKNIFKEINKNINFRKVDIKEAFKYNHGINVPMHKNRQKFFDDLEDKSVIDNIQECLKVSFIKKVLRKCKRIAKKILKKN